MTTSTGSRLNRLSAIDSPEESWLIISNAIKGSFESVKHNNPFRPIANGNVSRPWPFNHDHSEDEDEENSDVVMNLLDDEDEDTNDMTVNDDETPVDSQPQRPYVKTLVGRKSRPEGRERASHDIKNYSWPLVTIRNDVDENIEPAVEYLDELRFSKYCGIPLSQYPGCPCVDGGNYDEQKRLNSSKTQSTTLIYECNVWCGCPDDCLNRVAQKKRSIPLIVDRINDNGQMQWVVKAQDLIVKGTFIDQYIGEVISPVEAMRRVRRYSEEDESLVLDLFFGIQGDASEFIIDAVTYGNVTRFIRHSENPNASLYAVFYESSDLNYHRLAFFANKDIQPGEEITFCNWNLEP